MKELGQLCKYKHEHENTGKSLRYSVKNRTGLCVKCAAINTHKHYAANKEQKEVYAKKYRQENKAKIDIARHGLYEKNKEKILKQTRRYYELNKEKHKKWVKANSALPEVKARKMKLDARRRDIHKKELSDTHIKRLLQAEHGFKYEQMSPEIITVKRQHIVFYKELKQFKEEISNGTN